MLRVYNTLTKEKEEFKPLKEGEVVPLTLSFEKAGEMMVSVPVFGPAAMGPSGGAAMPGMPGMTHGTGHGTPAK